MPTMLIHPRGRASPGWHMANMGRRPLPSSQDPKLDVLVLGWEFPAGPRTGDTGAAWLPVTLLLGTALMDTGCCIRAASLMINQRLMNGQFLRCGAGSGSFLA